MMQMLIRAQRSNLIKGFSPGGDLHNPVVQYADDTILFTEESAEMNSNLRLVIYWFGMASGLKLNEGKTKLCRINQCREFSKCLQIWSRKEEILPCTYLGAPLGMRYKNRLGWRVVVERMKSKLALWKRRYLTKGGCLVLIRSTLSSLPIYLLSLFTVPVSVAKAIESIVRDFLWGSSADSKKCHLVNWEQVLLAEGVGGLRIQKIVDLNRALLCKWNWCLYSESDTLWGKVVSLKYKIDDQKRYTTLQLRNHGFSLWQGIRNSVFV